MLTLRAHADGREVVISVADTGPGIPADELARVFERMSRGGDARHAAPAGAGLGLPIAASLTDAMGGRIGVDSRVGEGTTFTVRLPASAPARARRFARLRARAAPGGSAALPPPARGAARLVSGVCATPSSSERATTAWSPPPTWR